MGYVYLFKAATLQQSTISVACKYKKYKKQHFPELHNILASNNTITDEYPVENTTASLGPKHSIAIQQTS
jgi:hypothetical protein